MNSISCFVIGDQSSIDLITQYINITPKLILRGSALDLFPALNILLSADCPDVLFINFDTLVSFELELNEHINRSRTLIVVSSSDKENAFKAFEAGYFDYVLSTFSYDRFLKTVSRLMRATTALKDKNYFYIQAESKGKIIKILYDQINYIEGNQNYINIFIDNGKHLTHHTMKVIEQKLPANTFIRVHKSYIVNESKIHIIATDHIILNDKTIIKIGPNYRQGLITRLL